MNSKINKIIEQNSLQRKGETWVDGSKYILGLPTQGRLDRSFLNSVLSDSDLDNLFCKTTSINWESLIAQYIVELIKINEVMNIKPLKPNLSLLPEFDYFFEKRGDNIFLLEGVVANLPYVSTKKGSYKSIPTEVVCMTFDPQNWEFLIDNLYSV